MNLKVTSVRVAAATAPFAPLRTNFLGETSFLCNCEIMHLVGRHALTNFLGHWEIGPMFSRGHESPLFNRFGWHIIPLSKQLSLEKVAPIDQDAFVG